MHEGLPLVVNPPDGPTCIGKLSAAGDIGAQTCE